MLRGTVTGFIVLAGCVAGIAGGYYMQSPEIAATLLSQASFTVPLKPYNFTANATVRAVDTENKNLTLEVLSPFEKQKTIMLKVSYDDTTTITDSKTNLIPASQLRAGNTVTIRIARVKGPLHLFAISES